MRDAKKKLLRAAKLRELSSQALAKVTGSGEGPTSYDCSGLSLAETEPARADVPPRDLAFY